MFTDAKEHVIGTLSMQVPIRGQTQRTDEKGIATFEAVPRSPTSKTRTATLPGKARKRLK